MSTVGWVLVIVGGLLARQVAVGRAAETPADFREGFLAVVRGDWDALRTIASGRGTNVETVALDSAPVSDVSGSGSGEQLISTMRQLGEGRPYVSGAEGPDAYDCSGLVWAALKKMGLYSGPRFVVHEFPTISKGFAQQVTDPKRGDVVVWMFHHIGVVTGDDRMFSALNPTDGICNSKISDNTSVQGQPIYFRLTK